MKNAKEAPTEAQQKQTQKTALEKDSKRYEQTEVVQQTNQIQQYTSEVTERIKEATNKRHIAQMTMQDVFDYSIANYIKIPDLEDAIYTYIHCALVELQNQFNVIRKMDDDQVNECAYTLMSENKNLSLRDFAMFFRTVKRGSVNGGKGEHEYKLPFDRIDLGLVNEWLRTYKVARVEAKQALEAKEEKSKPVVRVDNYHPAVIGAMQKAWRNGKAELEHKVNYLKGISREELEVKQKQAFEIQDKQAIRLIQDEIDYRRKQERVAYYEHRRTLIAELEEMNMEDVRQMANDANEKDRLIIEQYINAHESEPEWE